MEFQLFLITDIWAVDLKTFFFLMYVHKLDTQKSIETQISLCHNLLLTYVAL